MCAGPPGSDLWPCLSPCNSQPPNMAPALQCKNHQSIHENSLQYSYVPSRASTELPHSGHSCSSMETASFAGTGWTLVSLSSSCSTWPLQHLPPHLPVPTPLKVVAAAHRGRAICSAADIKLPAVIGSLLLHCLDLAGLTMALALGWGHGLLDALPGGQRLSMPVTMGSHITPLPTTRVTSVTSSGPVATSVWLGSHSSSASCTLCVQRRLPQLLRILRLLLVHGCRWPLRHRRLRLWQRLWRLLPLQVCWLASKPTSPGGTSRRHQRSGAWLLTLLAHPPCQRLLPCRTALSSAPLPAASCCRLSPPGPLTAATICACCAAGTAAAAVGLTAGAANGVVPICLTEHPMVLSCTLWLLLLLTALAEPTC